MAIAELGQHTASGIVLIGVAQAPAVPLLSFTPVKNRPTTARSTTREASSDPRISGIAARVSRSIAFSPVSILVPLTEQAAGAGQAGFARTRGRRATRDRRRRAGPRSADLSASQRGSRRTGCWPPAVGSG